MATVVADHPPLRGDAVLKDGPGFLLVQQQLRLPFFAAGTKVIGCPGSNYRYVGNVSNLNMSYDGLAGIGRNLVNRWRNFNPLAAGRIGWNGS